MVAFHSTLQHLLLASLALPTALAVSLIDFTPRVSNLASGCQAVYTASISGCQPSDFETKKCSSSCIAALNALQTTVEGACKGVTGQNILVAFLNGKGTSALCPNAGSEWGPTATSTSAAVPSSTQAPPTSTTEHSSTSSAPPSTASTQSKSTSETAAATTSTSSTSSSASVASSISKASSIDTATTVVSTATLMPQASTLSSASVGTSIAFETSAAPTGASSSSTSASSSASQTSSSYGDPFDDISSSRSSGASDSTPLSQFALFVPVLLLALEGLR